MLVDPGEQLLFRRLSRRRRRRLVGGGSIPRGQLMRRHRDGVVQDERPHQSENQLGVAVDDVSAVCAMYAVTRTASIAGLLQANPGMQFEHCVVEV